MLFFSDHWPFYYYLLVLNENLTFKLFGNVVWELGMQDQLNQGAGYNQNMGQAPKAKYFGLHPRLIALFCCG